MDSIEKSSFINKIGANILLPLLIIALFWACFFSDSGQAVETDFEGFLEENPLFSEAVVIQGNSLLSISSPLLVEEELKTIKELVVVVTGYSSSPWETDDTPYLTASGTRVRDGIVATNILPFGTKIRLPSIYGNKIFIVEDRMSAEKGYHIDIWFPSYQEAKNFGAKITEIEVIEERMEIAMR
jgi:3D (Asp-Asp-Asp) domain-containing protein